MSKVTPRDREEKLLAAIADGTAEELPTPRNRKEKLLKEIYDNGGGGGGGTSVTVDSKLSTTSKNPVQNKVITQALNEKGTYSKPTGGIPKADLASEVQTSLGKADTALQEHQDISGKANKADLTALSNTISDAWNASTTYAVGKYCIYNNSLWKCLVQHSGQTPTEGTYWTKVSVVNEITSVNNSFQAKLTNENSETFNFGVLNGVRGFFTNPSRADDCFIPFNSIKKVNMDSLGNKELFLGFKANFVFIFWESKPNICAFYLRSKSSNTVYFIENNNMNARTIGASNCPINSITDNSIVLHAWASDQLTEWSILAN